MTEVTIRRIWNGWILETSPDVAIYFKTVKDAGVAAEKLAKLPSALEEIDANLRVMKAMNEKFVGGL